MEVFSSGILKALPQYLLEVLGLDDGSTQQKCSTMYYHPIITFVLATLYPHEEEN